MDQHEVEFGLYAKICIANALISQLRALKKRNAERLSETTTDSLFDGTYTGDSEDPSLRVLEQESLRSLYSVIRGNLSDFEYLVWRLYMSGRTAREIGKKVGKDERSVNNAIYRIRKKLRERLQ
jgi:RNA polymerase sporulation-specific sigma factor